MTSRVVFASPSHDLAGSGYALKAAFDAAPDWEARAICRAQTYLRYPTDIVWSPHGGAQRREIAAIMHSADVLQAMNHPRALAWVRPTPSQRLVVHHLGSTFRRNPRAISAECRRYGATEVTDSIDLLFDGIGWLPIPADIERLSTLRAATYQPSSTIRIAHAPTNRQIKDTAAIVRAVESLSRKYPISFDLIERVPNAVCLKRKASADIFIDQLQYGFGLNAIECWAMGIPVVSGLTDLTALNRGRAMWGHLPWANATADTLEAVIEHLIVDEAWRHELGERGRAHADRWHSQPAVVAMATALYGLPVEAAA